MIFQKHVQNCTELQLFTDFSVVVSTIFCKQIRLVWSFQNFHHNVGIMTVFLSHSSFFYWCHLFY